MPKIKQETIEIVRASLKKKKVFDFPMLLFLLNCSVRSGRLKLKQWDAHTSYNRNGQYYALPDVPRFNEDGLWRYKDAYFSKYGTLKNTVVHLICASSAGLTGDQLGKIVRLSPRSFLYHFRDITGIQREKHQGVYVYFSEDEARYKQQVANRVETIALGDLISDADAIEILVALLNQHDITVDHIALLPEVKAKNLSTPAIANYLRQHGLEKKTLHSKR